MAGAEGKYLILDVFTLLEVATSKVKPMNMNLHWQSKQF